MLEKTEIPEVLVFTPKRFGDDRGFFSETWNRQTFAKLGIDADFVQDNHSHSASRKTVRGLHFQAPPHAQDKLVRVIKGSVFDVAVDIRKGSPTYGRWVGVELSAGNGKQLFVPKGFLHGFITNEPDTEVIYKCSDFYSPECDGAVKFNDPDIGIDWGMAVHDAVLSGKDAIAGSFADFQTPFIYEAKS